MDTCAYIEVGRLHKKKVVDLYKSSYLPYVINLNGMVQIKKDSGFRRKVSWCFLLPSEYLPGACSKVTLFEGSNFLTCFRVFEGFRLFVFHYFLASYFDFIVFLVVVTFAIRLFSVNNLV